MTTVKFKHGNKAQLNQQPIEDGVVYITEDTQEFAVDINGQRIFPSNIEYPVSIAKGGTGANNAELAYTNLGGGTVGKLNTTGSTTRFLRGDGGWEIPPDTDTWIAFQGATDTTEGRAGYIPAPEAGLQDAFFKGDGTWADIGGTVYVGSSEPSDDTTQIWISP